jgi:hypothetical protein
MLAELAIANAAFGVIKETIANGGDIMAAGQHIFKFFDSKSEIAKKANASGDADAKAAVLAEIKRKEELWAWINGILIAISVLSGVIFIAILVWAIANRGLE